MGAPVRGGSRSTGVVLLDARPGALRAPPVTLEDWPKEYRYLSVLQQSVREARAALPLRADHLLAQVPGHPETCLSPQVALLAVLPAGTFVVLNTLLAYAALLRPAAWLLSRRYAISPLPAAFWSLIAGVSGHPSAQMAVGHSMWTGFLLLPFVLLPLCSLAEGRPRATTPIALAIARSPRSSCKARCTSSRRACSSCCSSPPSTRRGRAPVVTALLWTGGWAASACCRRSSWRGGATRRSSRAIRRSSTSRAGCSPSCRPTRASTAGSSGPSTPGSTTCTSDRRISCSSWPAASGSRGGHRSAPGRRRAASLRTDGRPGGAPFGDAGVTLGLLASAAALGGRVTTRLVALPLVLLRCWPRSASSGPCAPRGERRASWRRSCSRAPWPAWARTPGAGASGTRAAPAAAQRA